MGVNPGVLFEDLRSNVENDRIPYVEAGSQTYAHVELRQVAGRPQQPDGGARMFIALSWSAGQGRLDSTGVRVYIESEAGTAVEYDRTVRLGGIFPGERNPKLWISLVFGPGPPGETYQASVNDYPLLGPWVAINGAENFDEARIFVATNNDSSQVPGATTNREAFTNVQYRSNWGWGSFGSQMKLRDALWGDSAFGAEFTHAWDTACATW